MPESEILPYFYLSLILNVTINLCGGIVVFFGRQHSNNEVAGWERLRSPQQHKTNFYLLLKHILVIVRSLDLR